MLESSKDTNQRVLIVDEGRSFSALFRTILPQNGYGEPVILDPVTALFSLDGHSFEVAFINADTPGALDLGRKIAVAYPGLGVIFFGDAASIQPLVADDVSGRYDFLVHPLTETHLLLALNRFEQKRGLMNRCAGAEARFARFMHDMPLLIFRVMEDFSLSFMNRACESMLGFSTEDAMRNADWLMDRVHEEDRVAVQRSLINVFQGFPPITVHCRMMHKNGYVVHGMLKTLPCGVYADDCGAKVVDCIFMDITERVQLENVMLQDEKLKTVDAISLDVAHEIRNPLVSIGGFARRLSAKVPDIPETDIILKESKRLEDLLERIRSYLDPLDLNRRPCSINEIIVESLDRVFMELEHSGLSVKLQLEDRLPDIVADYEALSRVFMNLIRNAANAMDPGGTIHVRSYMNGGTVNVDFSNALSDLKPLDPETMYSPFQRDNFGLPLAHRLLQSMGGHLSLSREKGLAVFTVAVPMHALVQEQESLI